VFSVGSTVPSHTSVNQTQGMSEVFDQSCGMYCNKSTYLQGVKTAVNYMPPEILSSCKRTFLKKAVKENITYFSIP
jgi:hypothetical protein